MPVRSSLASRLQAWVSSLLSQWHYSWHQLQPYQNTITSATHTQLPPLRLPVILPTWTQVQRISGVLPASIRFPSNRMTFTAVRHYTLYEWQWTVYPSWLHQFHTIVTIGKLLLAWNSYEWVVMSENYTLDHGLVTYWELIQNCNKKIILWICVYIR